LENLVVGTDGTMSDYCDVLRSNTADDVLTIEVLRTSTNEVLAGQLNGAELETVQTFARELQDQVPDGAGSGEGYTEYYEVRDDSGAIVVSVPVESDEVNGQGEVLDDGSTWPALRVSPDFSGFDGGYSAPGAIIAASSDLAVLTPEDVLDAFSQDVVGTDCAAAGRQPYDDGVCVGTYELHAACGGTETVIVLLAAKPVDGSFMVIVAVQATSDSDLAALDRILDSFAVVGDV